MELATVAPGTSEKEGLADALETARHADALGFHRIWFAEHHLTPMGASHHPELLMAAAATQTSGIRVGSGAVLLNHYSPFKIAEMFKQLEALFPGRVDLGMGRATAGKTIDLALRQDRQNPAQPDHPQQVAEVLAWLYGTFPAGHAFAGNPMMPSVPEVPQTWLLGSSVGGSNLAAGLGIGYTFSGFINPAGAVEAMRNYRERFQPKGHRLASPRSILAVNITVADTHDEARRLVGSARAFTKRVRAGDFSALVPSPDDAAGELPPTEKERPTSIVDGEWPMFVAGNPTEVRATLDQMVSESRADELMVYNLIADPGDRRRSHELLAEMFELAPRSAPAPALSKTHA